MGEKVHIKSFARQLRKNQTEAEKKLWFNINLRQLGGHKFRRQQVIDNLYIVDFICFEKRLIIELDGGQHTPEADKERTNYLNAQNFEVLRFWNNEVLENIDGVLYVIRHKLGITDI